MEDTIAGLLLEKRRDHFYLMHLTYDPDEFPTRTEQLKFREKMWKFAKDNGSVGIDRHAVEFDRPWNKYSESERKKLGLSRLWQWQFDTFYGMHSNACVVVMAGEEYLLGVGFANGEAKFEPELGKYGDFFRHIRSVTWEKPGRAYEWPGQSIPPRFQFRFRNTIRKVQKPSKSWKITQLPLG